MPAVSMTVNGKAATGTVEGRTLLVQFLREQLGLTGTHVGCDTSQCGACVVHVFREHHGLQCGFCTPGMVMSAVDLASRNGDPSEQDVREWLEGNICRCTGYHNIVKAVQAGARAMRS